MFETDLQAGFDELYKAMCMKCHLITLILCCFSLMAQSAQVSLSGFGSIGVVGSDSDIYGYRNDISQSRGVFKDDLRVDTTSVLGLQLDLQLSDAFDVVFQGVYRDQDNANIDSILSQAFVRYVPSVSWSFRAGRTPFDLYGLTEYRDIGFSFLWTKVPNEIYGIVPYRFLDGADATFQTQSDNYTLRSKVFFGESSADISSVNQAEEINLEDVIGLTVELESTDWILKANYTNTTIANNISRIDEILQGIALVNFVAPGAWPDSLEFANNFSLSGKTASYASFSGRYRSAQWTLLGEVSSIDGNGTLIRPLKNGFMTFAYHFDRHSLFASYSRTRAKRFNFSPPFDPATTIADPVSVGVVQQLFFGIAISGNFFASNQETLSLGTRWDINENLAFKLQWDHTMVDERGGTLWVVNDLTFSGEETVNTLHLNMSFIF